MVNLRRNIACSTLFQDKMYLVWYWWWWWGGQNWCSLTFWLQVVKVKMIQQLNSNIYNVWTWPDPQTDSPFQDSQLSTVWVSVLIMAWYTWFCLQLVQWRTGAMEPTLLEHGEWRLTMAHLYHVTMELSQADHNKSKYDMTVFGMLWQYLQDFFGVSAGTCSHFLIFQEVLTAEPHPTKASR